jgi:hypothetical protein
MVCIKTGAIPEKKNKHALFLNGNFCTMLLFYPLYKDPQRG